MICRVLVVDDEPLARVGVLTRLRFHADMQVVGECETGAEAVRAIHELAPDLIFLDIQLPDMSGIEVLRAAPRFSLPRVVFLTAHNQHALEAFDVQALDYLLKPIDDDRFLECLDRARRVKLLEQHQDKDATGAGETRERREQTDGLAARFAVREGASVLFVQARDVDWFEALGDYTGIHVGNKTHLIREPIGSLANRLDKEHFMRIHRSAIIRIEKLAKVKPLSNRDCVVTLKDGQSIRASRTFSEQLYGLLRMRS